MAMGAIVSPQSRIRGKQQWKAHLKNCIGHCAGVVSLAVISYAGIVLALQLRKLNPPQTCDCSICRLFIGSRGVTQWIDQKIGQLS